MDTLDGGSDSCVKQDYRIDGDGMTLLEESRYTIERYGICATYQ
jgi:hypothetical protein